jgi:hypothetical protein
MGPHIWVEMATTKAAAAAVVILAAAAEIQLLVVVVGLVMLHCLPMVQQMREVEPLLDL